MISEKCCQVTELEVELQLVYKYSWTFLSLSWLLYLLQLTRNRYFISIEFRFSQAMRTVKAPV